MKTVELYHMFRKGTNPNIFTDGYVGIGDADSRIRNHLNGAGNSSVLERAGVTATDVDCVIYEIPEELGKALEVLLRPAPNIGWNQNKGGQRAGGATNTIPCKLTNNDKQKARTMLNAGHTQKDVAQYLNVNQSAISYHVRKGNI